MQREASSVAVMTRSSTEAKWPRWVDAVDHVNGAASVLTRPRPDRPERKGAATSRRKLRVAGAGAGTVTPSAAPRCTAGGPVALVLGFNFGKNSVPTELDEFRSISVGFRLDF